MKVFISWSKEPSKTVAAKLRTWILQVLQAVEPWMSEEDIEGGTRWGETISKELAETKFGIVCVSGGNQHNPWLTFESGALAKTLDDMTKVVPYLINLQEHEVTGPLAQFHSVKGEKEGTLRLIQSLNNSLQLHGEKSLDEIALNEAFEMWWPRLAETLEKLPEEEAKKEQRRPEDMIIEILADVREIKRDIQQAEKYRSFSSERVRRVSELSSELSIVDVHDLYSTLSKIEPKLRPIAEWEINPVPDLWERIRKVVGAYSRGFITEHEAVHQIAKSIFDGQLDSLQEITYGKIAQFGSGSSPTDRSGCF